MIFAAWEPYHKEVYQSVEKAKFQLDFFDRLDPVTITVTGFFLLFMAS